MRMCTYQTQTLTVNASAKTPQGWATMTDASVYFDHPVHFMADHALIIDVLNTNEGSRARVALEMDATSARALAESILLALDQVPVALRDETTIP